MIILDKGWKTSARGGALLVLEEVLDKGAYSNIALNAYLSSHKLKDADKALLTEIVYGTVTRKITLEWYLAHLVKDRDALEPWVYQLLLLSYYQLLYLDKLPQHAVVDEAVKIAKKRGKQRGQDKYVNAILRAFLRNERPDVSNIKRVNKRLSVTYSLPVWLVKKLIEQFGEKRAYQLFASLLERSRASIRVTQPERLEAIKELTGTQKSRLSPVGLVGKNGHFAGSSLFKEGAITIQDETSQLVAPTLKIQGSERILDACAAPGGKTVHMAAYLTTGKLIALDLYDHKLALIQENAKRLHLSDKIETHQLDARQVHKQFPNDYFDKILVDAPCSGIGLIRRKPDTKYQKTSQDFEALQAIQLAILDSVCQTVRKGGIITYSTCTIFKEENQMVLKQFLESHPNFEQVALSHAQEAIVTDGCLLITPEQYQTDGFFIAQVRRLS